MQVNLFDGPPFKFKQACKDHTKFANCVRYRPSVCPSPSRENYKNYSLFWVKYVEGAELLMCFVCILMLYPCVIFP